MAETEHRFTVLVRLPFNRGDFVDPPPVAWNAAKERQLWEIISRQSKSNDIDWKELSETFDVTQTFLLQQAAWLYERQLSQVRAQMRRVGSRQSSNPSVGHVSMTESGVGAQPMRRDISGGAGSRTSSRLSLRAKDPIILKAEPGSPGGTSRSKVSQPPLATTLASRQFSKDESNRPQEPTNKRPVLSPQGLTQSPKDMHLSSSSSSSGSLDRGATSRMLGRRRDRSSVPLRPRPRQRPQSPPSNASNDEGDEDEDLSPFLPFAATDSHATHKIPDPSGTSTTNVAASSQVNRSVVSRKKPPDREPTLKLKSAVTKIHSPSGSSASSSSSGALNQKPGQVARPQAPVSQRVTPSSPPADVALSPRRAAELAATGLSPLRRPAAAGGKEGSDESPSMGSSFSDLEDASVTQSALEEALLSNFQHGRDVGMASRMSTISQALRSRVFDPANRQ